MYVEATMLGRERCPWPELLPGTDGHDPAFAFTAAPPQGAGASVPAVPAAAVPAAGAPPPGLVPCLRASGARVVDASDPAALAAAARVWNKRFAAQPLAVVYPADTAQVAAAVKCSVQSGVRAVPRQVPPAGPPWSLGCMGRMHQQHQNQQSTVPRGAGGAAPLSPQLPARRSEQHPCRGAHLLPPAGAGATPTRATRCRTAPLPSTSAGSAPWRSPQTAPRRWSARVRAWGRFTWRSRAAPPARRWSAGPARPSAWGASSWVRAGGRLRALAAAVFTFALTEI